MSTVPPVLRALAPSLSAALGSAPALALAHAHPVLGVTILLVEALFWFFYMAGRAVLDLRNRKGESDDQADADETTRLLRARFRKQISGSSPKERAEADRTLRQLRELSDQRNGKVGSRGS